MWGKNTGNQSPARDLQPEEYELYKGVFTQVSLLTHSERCRRGVTTRGNQCTTQLLVPATSASSPTALPHETGLMPAVSCFCAGGSCSGVLLAHPRPAQRHVGGHPCGHHEQAPQDPLCRGRPEWHPTVAPASDCAICTRSVLGPDQAQSITRKDSTHIVHVP